MKKNIFYKLFPGLLVLFMTAFAFDSDEGPGSLLVTDIKAKIAAYYKKYPQQKVYLHIDKSRYNIADKVWFKAYLVEATGNRPDTRSDNLYVELINPNGDRVQMKRIRMVNGIGNGDFSFNDTVPEGRYQLRAYTNWMLNMDPGFFFNRDIYVENPLFKNYATREKVHKVKKSVRKNENKNEKYDLSFHPEGGNLLSGIVNRVAFKAINHLGYSIPVKGKLTDSKANVILQTESIHGGMGSFEFTPEDGEKYYFLAESPGLKSEKFKLPETKDAGINLSVDEDNKKNICINLITNLEPGNYPPNTYYALLAHKDGEVCFTGLMELAENKRQICIPRDSLPTGLIHFTLFNYRSSPVSQRLIFVNHNDGLRPEIHIEKTSPGKRDIIKGKVDVKDRDGNAVKGSFSMAVVSNENMNRLYGISSHLLLGANLKGNIEDPEYYFTGDVHSKATHLDLLMLTQGWTRFEWTDVILNKNLDPEYSFQKKIEIGGKITRELFGLPLRDIKVTLTVLNEYNDIFQTRSGKDGSFIFDDLDYSDSIDLKVEAVKANGKKSLVIILDDEIPKKPVKYPYYTEQYLKKPGEQGKIKTNPRQLEKEERDRKESEKYYRIHSVPNSSNVIIIDEKLRNYTSVAQVIQGRIPGVNVIGNQVTIRGPNSFYGSQDPLFLIDGMPTDMRFAMQMSPMDVERIEILKGPEASIYGLRGANGVIAIYTRRGDFLKKGELDFSILGYVTPSEFYSPRYDIRKDEEFEDSRTTLLWIPTLNQDENGTAEFEFFTSDLPGDYSIIIEGINGEGKCGTGTTVFRVN